MRTHITVTPCSCPDCPVKGKHIQTYECFGNCPNHGPFPTDWELFSAYPERQEGKMGILERWERFIEKDKIESKIIFKEAKLEDNK